MTKPGNSDPDGGKTEDAPVEESTKDPIDSADTADTTDTGDSTDTADSTAPAEDAESTTDSEAEESAEDAEPAGEAPAAAKKSKAAKKSAAAKDSADAEDATAAEGHDLMSELEKAPPAPDEPPPAKPRKREKPVMPTAEEAARARPDMTMPKVIKYAFYGFIAAAVLWLVGAIQLIAVKQQIIDESIKASLKMKASERATPQEIMDAITTYSWLLLVLAIVFGSLWVLFGYKAQDGIRRARILLTILVVINALLHLALLPPISLLALVATFISMIALVLLYTPKSSIYFRAHQGT